MQTLKTNYDYDWDNFLIYIQSWTIWLYPLMKVAMAWRKVKIIMDRKVKTLFLMQVAMAWRKAKTIMSRKVRTILYSYMQVSMAWRKAKTIMGRKVMTLFSYAGSHGLKKGQDYRQESDDYLMLEDWYSLTSRLIRK